MHPACIHCGHPTEFCEAGLVCTSCAELVEPAAVVLANDVDYAPSTAYDWIPSSHKTLKTGRSRYLAGQGKEARNGKHLDDMRSFIKNLARAAFVSGTTDRAYHLFQKAMESGQYRWGRTARLLAGACISIALRETNRPDMFPDLALLLDQKVTNLTRTFSSVVSCLKLQDILPWAEPKSHVSTLQAHLSVAVKGSVQSELPSSLTTVIKPLPANAILATATSLSDLLASSVPPSAVARLPAPPTACAVLIWAIEAEARSTLTPLGDLAAFLGSKCNVSKPVVMSRYKVIQDELLERIEKIDWLDHYEPNNGRNGRAKIPRRIVVARGLKAAIECERESRRQELNEARPTDGRSADGGESDSDDPEALSRPRKRRRVHALQAATRFLLNPLLGPLPASFIPDLSRTPSLPLPTYLLTSSLSMRRSKLPSRLQLLSVVRGGVGYDEIQDDELFDDGELEKIMRTEEEVVELRNILGWDVDGKEEEVKEPPKPKKRRAVKDPKPTSSSRLIPDAVAHFFTDQKSDDEFGELLQLDSDSPDLIIENDGDGTDAFIGLHRTLVANVIEEEKDGPFSPSPSPEPGDRYTQEV
ncbi:hypothetical protein C8R43DRAFT_909436 [Mycena crocata]|nr:hypothetical protein C8R43DRAFT_909436 [Mycena crocata]